MSRLKLLRKEVLLRNIMIITLITCIVLICCLFCLRFIVEKHIARLANYRVSIPGKPDISGKIYSIGDKRYSLSEYNYLLVLTSKKMNNRECYYINFKHNLIGIPLFGKSRSIRFIRNSLIIDDFVLQGYYKAIDLNADWEMDKNELRVRIKDFPTKKIEYEKSRNIFKKEFFPKQNPIAYQEWIVLTELDKNS